MSTTNSLNDGQASPAPRICDYEGSPYRRVFWEERDRSYEDATERLALRALLPPTGERIVEIGAGFGRLAGEYAGYGQIFLLDYARSMLEDARERLGDACTYVCADLYNLPFATHALDTVVQIRVLHHVEGVPRAFAEVARSLRAGGTYVLEFANKRNLKAIARYAAGAQAENPFDDRPHEFVPLNWNFHPAHIARALTAADLPIVARRAVSHFRAPLLKRALSASLLARADDAIGGPLGHLALAPSQFVRAVHRTGAARTPHLWRCPKCGHQPLTQTGDALPCPRCASRWPIINGIYVFREPIDIP